MQDMNNKSLVNIICLFKVVKRCIYKSIIILQLRSNIVDLVWNDLNIVSVVCRMSFGELIQIWKCTIELYKACFFCSCGDHRIFFVC